MILVPLLNPKFANVQAAVVCELPVRGTSLAQRNGVRVSIRDVILALG